MKIQVKILNYYDYLYGIFTTADVWYFIMYTPKGIYLSERYLIDITLNDDTKLRKELKNVMKIIVGLLKDRVEADDSFANKESRVKNILNRKV